MPEAEAKSERGAQIQGEGRRRDSLRQGLRSAGNGNHAFRSLGRLSAERRGSLGMSRCCMSMRTPSSFIQPVFGSG